MVFEITNYSQEWCFKSSQPDEDCWTEETTLQNKLYGTRGDLQRTAKFIAATGLSVKSNETRQAKRPAPQPSREFEIFITTSRVFEIATHRQDECLKLPLRPGRVFEITPTARKGV